MILKVPTIKNKKPQVWMIQIPDNPISIHYRNYVKPSWVEQGFTIRYYDAVTPKTLNKQSFPMVMNFKKSGRSHRHFTPTEKAVWYSHRNLWRFCAHKLEPIIIIEHDILLVEQVADDFFSDHKIIGMGSSYNRNNRDIIHKSAGTAYYLTPNIAKRLLGIENSDEITTNSDAHLHRYIDKFGVWKHSTCRQYVDESIGKTIEHN